MYHCRNTVVETTAKMHSEIGVPGLNSPECALCRATSKLHCCALYTLTRPRELGGGGSMLVVKCIIFHGNVDWLLYYSNLLGQCHVIQAGSAWQNDTLNIRKEK